MFEDIYQWGHLQVTQNEIFAGIVGGSLVGSLLYLARGLPNVVFDFFLNQLTCLANVHSEDQAFHWLCEWMAAHPYSQTARRLTIATTDSNGAVPRHSDSKDRWVVSPGEGWHLLWFRRRPVWVVRTIRNGPGQQGSNGPIKETISVRTLGRSQGTVREIAEEMRLLRSDGGRVDVKVYDGWWRNAAKRVPRSLDSLILRDGQLESVIEDASWFFGAAEWYAHRGIPWRRGYLFSGQPGTGKSTFAFVLASHFKRPLCVLNLGSLDGDSDLFSAMAEMPPDGILLIEDVDAANNFEGSARRRKSNNSQPAKKKGDGEEKPLTLSAFLNAIDGVASVDGRLLIMTSNCPDTLDEALVRPGRVDRHEIVGPLETKAARRLFLRFWPNHVALSTRIHLQQSLPAAAIQESFVRHRDNPRDAVSAVNEASESGFTGLTAFPEVPTQEAEGPSQRKVKA